MSLMYYTKSFTDVTFLPQCIHENECASTGQSLFLTLVISLQWTHTEDVEKRLHVMLFLDGRHIAKISAKPYETSRHQKAVAEVDLFWYPWGFESVKLFAQHFSAWTAGIQFRRAKESLLQSISSSIHSDVLYSMNVDLKACGIQHSGTLQRFDISPCNCTPYHFKVQDMPFMVVTSQPCDFQWPALGACFQFMDCINW